MMFSNAKISSSGRLPLYILTNRSLLYGVIRLGLRKRYQLSFVCTDFPVYYMCEPVSYLHIYYHEDYTDNG